MTDFRPAGVANVDGEGNPVFTSNYRTVSTDGYRKRGITFTATAGEVTIYDLQLSSAVNLRGGWAWVSSDAVLGDGMYFSIVDKDDVLGLFVLYGLTVGVDVLEIVRYIDNFFIPPGGLNGYMEDPGTYSALISGLYLRTAYDSAGANDVDVIIHYSWYEVGAP